MRFDSSRQLTLKQFAELNELRKSQLENGKVAATVVSQLRPYKVDNAIIMAAGMASRFAPISSVKPKGLLKVRGEVLIERQIRQLHEAGIKDVTVVVGYMKEKFNHLIKRFGVALVENKDYMRYNNTSTLMCVLGKLQNTYVCSSDNYFTENVFEPYVYQSYYAARFFPGKAYEWGIKVNKDGRIVGIDHDPVDMWCMMGHVYFDRAFSAAFKKILRAEFKRESTKTELWESVYERHIHELTMSIRPYAADVIQEFDALEDVLRFDETFMANCGVRIRKLIAGGKGDEKC